MNSEDMPEAVEMERLTHLAGDPDSTGTAWPQLIAELAEGHTRVIVVGESGAGKTTLIRTLVTALSDRGQTGYCLNCDPGLPGFGVPGTVSLGRFDGHKWHVLATEPLCSLDAGRFRLPLLLAVTRLLTRAPPGPLFLDSPGVVRGVGGAELIPALVTASGAGLCLLLCPEDKPFPLAGELAALPVRLIRLTPSAHAHTLARPERVRLRNQLWQAHMAHSSQLELATDGLALLGTPPSLDNPAAWQGRQVALLCNGEFKTLACISGAAPHLLQLQVAAPPGPVNQLLVRDAAIRDGQLRTLRKPPALPDKAPRATEVRVELGALTSVAREPQVAIRIGQVVATLVNGVTGDPLMQLRMLHHPRSLLFDLGDAGRMPLRAAHQVSDVFITHAHADHIGGFVWFMRSRIGHFPPCRLYGPPGLHRHILGMVNGILWDRVEDRGPCFEIHEWYGEHLRRWRIVAGIAGAEPLEDLPLREGVIRREPGFVMRATQLDHRVPVLAYSYEPRFQLHMRRDGLAALGLAPGPWLQELKQAWLNDELDRTLAPDGRTRFTVAELASQLLLEEPGEQVVYATDFRDSPENIDRLCRLARGAHTLFCESSFLCEDKDQAVRTQHLTTEACARIANLADVRQLIAFHFSHRYDRQRERVYQELCQYTDRVVIPDGHRHGVSNR